jgi:hypothetical protein
MARMIRHRYARGTAVMIIDIIEAHLKYGQKQHKARKHDLHL